MPSGILGRKAKPAGRSVADTVQRLDGSRRYNNIAGNKKLNRTDIAAFFGVQWTMVDVWVRAGCPVDRYDARNRAVSFDIGAVARWWLGWKGVEPWASRMRTVDAYFLEN